MKLKIIINKMDTFINGTVNNIIKSYSVHDKVCKFNYFELYQTSFSNLNDEEQKKIINIIYKNKQVIDKNCIDDIIHFLSSDVSNISVEIDNKLIKNYIIFCMYCYILEAKIENIHFNEHNILSLHGKDRPNRFLGYMYSYDTNEYICDIMGFSIIPNTPFENISEKIIHMKKYKAPVPYCDIYDNFVVYEKLNNIDPNVDPLVNVLKDITNQLRYINKRYKFEYFDKNDIGKSNLNFRRYHIGCFETLIDNKTTSKSNNKYSDVKKSGKITKKDQLKTLIYILSELYITGDETYEEKIKFQPFKNYLEYIEKLDDKNCHDDFIHHLIDN